jgi:prophage DNA circulation protein
MGWRDDLQSASFRGVPFFVASHDASTGRELVVHKFPLRDPAFVEDLGRRNRTFSVEAYVVGDNYMAARDALLDALEAEGPGRLVHPYRGELTCAVGSASWRESSTEGGYCSFQLDFVEAESQVAQPSEAFDPVGLIGDAASGLLSDAAAAFEDVFSVLQQPQFAIDSLQTILERAASEIGRALSPIVRGVQALARLQTSVAALKADAAVLLRQPAKLAAQFQSVFSGVRGAFGVPESGVRALTGLAGMVQPVPAAPSTTPVRRQELANQKALMTLIRATSAAEAALAALEVKFSSYEDAVEVRDDLLAALDLEMATAPDSVYASMSDLSAALVRAVPGNENALARLVTVTPPSPVPAVVLAYALYGDLRSEMDIVSRNSLRNPLFVPGGQPIKVLGRV